MTTKTKREVEVFTAGCPCCDEVVSLIEELTCDSCGVVVHDMTDAKAAKRAKDLGIAAVPAVVVNGKLVRRAKNAGYDKRTLQAAGIGKAL